MDKLVYSVNRKIIHIDMDAFYVSVEIRDNPELIGKPVAVGGYANKRGVLATCNYIARSFGIHSAMPTSVALRKCPNLVLVPGRMNVYKDISQKIRQIMLRYTDVIEPLSLDEAYLDVTHCKQCQGSATLIAQEIRTAIFNELNLTASAGVAPIKYLAKIASDLNKPNGQFVIKPNEVSDFISKMPLNKIPGVGKVTYEKLLVQGFKIGKDITQANEQILASQFGKLGKLLWLRCHGIDDRAIETSRIRKSVGVERTFPVDISDIKTLQTFLFEDLIPELKKRAAPYLQNRQMSKLGIKVKFKDFHQTTTEQKQASFNDDVFLELLSESLSRGKGKAVRLLGVHIGLADVINKKCNYSQLSLALSHDVDLD